MTEAASLLEVAEQLLEYARTQAHGEAIASVELAIASLDLCLNLPASASSLSTELRARLLLASALHEFTHDLRRAEQVVSKGLVRVGLQEQYVDWKMAFNDLLCRILIELGSVNAAKSVMKDSIAICTEREPMMDKWRVLFMLRTFEVENSLSSIRNIRALAVSRCNTQLIQLCSILDSIVYIQQGLPIPASISPRLNDDAQRETPSMTILDHLHLAISILGDVLNGNIAKSDVAEEKWERALPKLALIHASLDANLALDTRICIEISTVANSDIKDSIHFNSFSTRRFMIFIYLLSGLVHLPDITSSKSEKFLAEGHKQLQFEIQDCSIRDDWINSTQINLHFCKALNYMLHTKFNQSQAEIDALQQMKFDSPFLTFLRGCLAQQMGDIDTALKCYEAVTSGEMSNYCLLNTVLIYRGNIKPNPIKAKDLLQHLEPKCSHGPLRTAFEIVSSVSPGTTSVVTKRILTSVLNAGKLHVNTQFNLLSLSILGVKSPDPDDMRLKFSSYALNQAIKSANGSVSVNPWSLFNGKVVQELYQQAGDHAKEAKVRDLNQKNSELMKNVPAVERTINQ